MDYVFFDLDDTLYDQAEPFARAYAEVFGPGHGIDPVEVFPVSRKYSESVFEASESGEMRMEDMYVYRIQRALADFGLDASDEDCLRMHYRYAYHQEHDITLSPTICAILDWCVENAHPGIISNGPADHQTAKMDVLGIERWIGADSVFISSVEGVAKPHPGLFEAACRYVGTTPDRCIYVGDSFGPDVGGAHAAHMPVVWFDRRGRPATSDIQPNWIVHTEQELLELLPTI